MERLTPPWTGITSMELEDAAVFFGRDDKIIRVAQKCEAKRILGGPNLTFIVGPSGSGKSSLLKAGVLPYLSRSSGHWITLPPFRPGLDPVDSLLTAFATEFEMRGTPCGVTIDSDPRCATTAASAKLKRGRFADATILVAIDQIEELFSVTPSEQRQRFADLLQFMLEGDRRRSFLALATIRSDRLGDFLAVDGFQFSHDALTVGPMPRARLRSVIEGPTRVAGLSVEPALIDRICADAAGGGDMLPLVAFALREMYERRESRKTLSVAEYERLGDSANSLRPLDCVIAQMKNYLAL